MSGSAGRGRRGLWAILSFLFVVGVVVSTVMAPSDQDGGIDAAAATARDEAEIVEATLTSKQLTKPVEGSSYEKLSAELSSSLSSDGTIVGVTVWAPKGRILFSLNESHVGKTRPGMRSLITSIANGSGSTRVTDEEVQTFTPVSKQSDGPVAIVQIDQPVAVLEAETGELWSTLRLGSGLGLAVSLLLLILAFVRPWRRVRPREHEGRGRDEAEEGDVVAATNGEGQPNEASRLTYEEVFGHGHAPAETIAQDGDLEGDHGTVEGDHGTVEAEPGTVEAEPGTEPGTVEADPDTVDADPGTVEADPDTVDADPGAVEGDPEEVEGDPEALKSIQQWQQDYEARAFEELQAQELMRQRREEFKARAQAAALRVKKLEAEPQEASPTPELIARDDGRQD